MFFSIKDVFINLLLPKKRRLPWDFNSTIYRYLYNDIDNCGKKPFQHYCNIGMKEGRLYKKSAFVKRTSLDRNLETIIFYSDDENENLFFIDGEKVLYNYMYSFPDQSTIFSKPTHHVEFAADKINTKIVFDYGDISFADGFDVFAKISSLYKLQYSQDETEFIWLRALNNGSNASRFEQTQTWSQISKADHSYRIISTKSFYDDYYQKAAVFFDRSRFLNKISHAKSAFQAGKAVFALDGVMPLSARYQQENIAEQYLLSQTNDQEFISTLHEHLIAADKTNKDQLDAISTRLGSVDQFVDELLNISDTAARQIKQEGIDAIELFGKKEFDFSFWIANSLKPFTKRRARQYIRSWKSGVYLRRSCPGFQPDIYAEYHDLGLERKDTFLHYLDTGQPDGPWRWDILTKPIKIEPTALTQKIALQIHTYYIEKLEVMLNALLANEVRPDLFISVKNEADKQIAKNMLINYPAKVKVLVTENRGRDIGPLLTLFRQQLRNGYDIISHMHSKTFAHMKNRLYTEIWAQYLTMNLLSDGATIKTADTIIQSICDDKNINFVFPKDRNSISWTKIRLASQKLTQHLGLDKLINYINSWFGTIFWTTNKLMKSFFKLEIG